jgi:hypothetical protein
VGGYFGKASLRLLVSRFGGLRWVGSVRWGLEDIVVDLHELEFPAFSGSLIFRLEYILMLGYDIPGMVYSDNNDVHEGRSNLLL